jgi:hypothetical protein
MDDIAGGQKMAAGDFGIARRVATDRAAFCEEFWSGGAMDRAVHAAPAEKRRIGGVHDGVDVKPRDVFDDDFEHRTGIACPKRLRFRGSNLAHQS